MFRNILLATDFSAHSEMARKAAISLCRGEEKKLTVLHVYDLHQKFLEEGVLLASELVESAEKKRISRETSEKMENFCEPIIEEKINFESEILEGKPSDVIIQKAGEIGADLVVIGSHSSRGFMDVSLGGVTRRVGEKAPCPVLIITNYKEEKPQEETAPEIKTDAEPAPEEKS